MLPIDDDLREACTDEELLEVRLRHSILYTYDLVAGEHAVTYLEPREGDGILDNLDLRLYPRGLPIIRAVCEVVL